MHTIGYLADHISVPPLTVVTTIIGKCTVLPRSFFFCRNVAD